MWDHSLEVVVLLLLPFYCLWLQEEKEWNHNQQIMACNGDTSRSLQCWIGLDIKCHSSHLSLSSTRVYCKQLYSVWRRWDRVLVGKQGSPLKVLQGLRRKCYRAEMQVFKAASTNVCLTFLNALLLVSLDLTSTPRETFGKSGVAL